MLMKNVARKIIHLEVELHPGVSWFIFQDFIFFVHKNSSIAIELTARSKKVFGFVSQKALYFFPLVKDVRITKFLLHLKKRILCLLKGIRIFYSRKVYLVGIGFRCWLIKKTKTLCLILKVGFSKDLVVVIPNNIMVFCLKNSEILIRGIDKEAVNSFVFSLQQYKKPEPYKLKGIQIEAQFALKQKKLSKN